MNLSDALRGWLLVVLAVAMSVAADPMATETSPPASPSDLSSVEPERRLAAARALAGDAAAAREAVPQLTLLLEDPVADVRVAAATALGAAGPDAAPAVAALIDALDDKDLDSNGQPVWLGVSQGLGAIGPKALPELQRALDDSRPQVWRGVLGAIYFMGPAARDAVPDLVARLEKDDKATRLLLIQVLSALGPSAAPAVPVLTRYLAHEDFHSRYWSAQALGAIGPEARSAVPALIERTREDVPSVRRHSAAALGRIGSGIGTEGLQALVALLDDPLEPPREDAAEALGRLEAFAQPAVEKLRSVVENRKIAARTVAARSVWKITGQKDWSRDVLLGELADITWAARALEVLQEMGFADAACARLTAQLGAKEPVERLAAAESLGLMGPAARNAIDALERATADADPNVARAAARSLEAIREGKSAPPLE